MRHVGSGRVHHINIAVDEERVRPALETKQSIPRGSGCIRPDTSQSGFRHAQAFQDFELRRLDPTGFRIVSEENDVFFGQQRAPGPDTGELPGAATEDVRHDHAIEDPRRCGLGRVEVQVTVEVQEAEARLMTEQVRNHPETQGAVTAQHERQPAARNRPVDTIGRLAGHVHEQVEVLLPGVIAIRTKGDGGQVTNIGNIQALPPQRLEKTGVPKRGGRPRLSRQLCPDGVT